MSEVGKMLLVFGRCVVCEFAVFLCATDRGHVDLL